MRNAMSIAVGSLVATFILLGTAVGAEVFVTDMELTGFAEPPPPPPDAAYPTEDVASCCDLDDACCGSAMGCGPVWTVWAGSLIMDRSTPDDAVLVTDAFGETLLDAHDFDFDFRGGWEVGAIRHNVGCTCLDLEARYARIDGWRAVRDFVYSPYGWVVPYAGTPIGDTRSPALVGGVYESHFDSMELNLRQSLYCGALTLVGGFRFAELDERGMSILNVSNQGLATTRVGAINDLFGIQGGADARFWQCGCLSLDGKLRAGIYTNKAVSTVFQPQTSSPEILASRASQCQSSFLGELGLTGTCQLTEDWALRAGYEVMWLDNVAVASDQIAVSNPAAGVAAVDTHGSVLYHGAMFTLVFSR